MLQNTKGIVLRAVKYGETSLIVSVFTELFGMQSYIISGVRRAKVRQGPRAGHFQPGSLLDLVVYHHDRQSLQRIRESQWSSLYAQIDTDVRKHSVMFFMVELLQKCLRQPEPQPELFGFVEESLLELDAALPAVTANMPVFFALHLSHFFGFRMEDTHSAERPCLDLLEGRFVGDVPGHPHWVDGAVSGNISLFLKAMRPAELAEFALNREQRRSLIDACLRYYTLHLGDFGAMRTLPVLQEVLD